MKKLIIILLSFIAFNVNATIYYVATDGDDNTGDGSIGNPWYSWDAANGSLSAGDTLYIRGGTYTDATFSIYYAKYHITGVHGTINDTVKIMNYPGESPVWSVVGGISTAIASVALQFSDCDYIYVRGLRLSNTPMTGGGHVTGMNIINSSNMVIDRCTVDRLSGSGFKVGDEMWGRISNTEISNNITFLNCDAWGNENTAGGDPYGYSDGFAANWNTDASPQRNMWITNLSYIGCRSYFNADDGWDFYGNDSGPISIENCWSFYNGFHHEDTTATGNGVGYKLGPTRISKQDYHQITVTNSLAIGNRENGFDQNTIEYTSIHWLYNNIAYENGNYGFMYGYDQYHGTEEAVSVFRNNAALGNGTNRDFDAWHSSSYNSWDGGVTITTSDFESVDDSGLANARAADGALPTLTFLHIAEGSDLIDAGIDVGLPYDGLAPDIGIDESNWSYESGGSTPTPNPDPDPSTPVKRLYTIEGVKQIYYIDGVPYIITVNE